MKNVARNLDLDWYWNLNKNIDYGYIGNDRETFKKVIIIFIAGCVFGVLLAVMFAGFLYGIQQKTVDEGKLSYGKLFLIIIVPCILLGLIAGILLL
jgi:uncharacterized membrane protein YdbT with pleckstrin-like domain